jgi:predicted Rossmann-fold nucleotide-binding protein
MNAYPVACARCSAGKGDEAFPVYYLGCTDAAKALARALDHMTTGGSKGVMQLVCKSFCAGGSAWQEGIAVAPELHPGRVPRHPPPVGASAA